MRLSRSKIIGRLLSAVVCSVWLMGRTIEVPLDYKAPEMGRAPLYFEFGASFDPTKPVVFIIADGQQFYVRRGSVAELQHTLFGDAFNVVGIVGRGFTPEFIKAA